MKILLTAVVLWIWLSPEAFGLSLDEAVEMAVASNPDLRSALEGWHAAQSDISRVTSLPDPRLEVTIGQSGSDYEGSMTMVAVAQKIPFPLKILESRTRASLSSCASYATYESLKRQIIREVKQTYIELAVLEKTIEVYEQDLAEARLLREVMVEKYRVGVASEHDLLKAELEVLAIEDELRGLREDDRTVALLKLKRLLNVPPEARLGELEPVEVDLDRIEPDSLRVLDVSNAPQVETFKLRQEIARSSLRLAHLEWVPDLGLKVFREDMDMAMGRNRKRGLMVSLNLPIWTWRNRSLISRQRLRLGQAEADLEAKRDEIELKLRQAVASFESTRKSYEFFNSAIIPESELALRAAKQAYETGKVDILTLIAAQRALRQVQLSAIRLWGRAAKRLAEIEEITGEDLI